MYTFWFNTTYACGAVICNANGIITDACPIYRKWRGRHFRWLISHLGKFFIEYKLIERG